jgi:hypothetical protein
MVYYGYLASMSPDEPCVPDCIWVRESDCKSCVHAKQEKVFMGGGIGKVPYWIYECMLTCKDCAERDECENPEE